MPTGSSDFDGAFHMLLTFDLAEIKVPFNGFSVGPTIGGAHGLQKDIAAQKINDLGKRTCPVQLRHPLPRPLPQARSESADDGVWLPRRLPGLPSRAAIDPITPTHGSFSLWRQTRRKIRKLGDL